MKQPEKLINLKQGEQIFRVIRHHFLMVVPHLTCSFLILLLDFFMMFYLVAFGWWGVALFVFVLVVVAFYVFRVLFLWNYNLIFITDDRIIDYERSGFFDQLISEFPYTKIKNITGKMKGFWQTIFKYGDLRLELVDQSIPFELYNVKRPFRLLEQLNKRINVVKMGKNNFAEQQNDEEADRYERIIKALESMSKESRNILLNKIKERFDLPVDWQKKGL